jgi:hypothetical protein
MRKKRIPFKSKPTQLKNWKNKCKVHLNLKKSICKTTQMDFEMENKWRKKLPCTTSLLVERTRNSLRVVAKIV